MVENKLNVGINGAGRIGRALIRLLESSPHTRLVWVNDLASAETVAHLLRYDSVYGRTALNVTAGPHSDTLCLGETEVTFSSHAAPGQIPWGDAAVDAVVESTGRFVDARARGHLESGVGRVIVSAVSDASDQQILLGKDSGAMAKDARVVSTGSCTTHAVALPLHVLDEWLGVEAAHMTTVHCTTGSQTTMDSPHADLRRARSSLVSMIPTTTSASRGLSRAFPHLADRLTCSAIRVPTASVSAIELVVQTRKAVPSAEAVNDRFRQAAQGSMKGRLGVCDEPLVSVDFRGDAHSCVVDGLNTSRPGRNLVRVLGWYDNEWGYANRVAELLELWGANLTGCAEAEG